MKLENIRAIVTGAASGIGRCIALEMARAGAKVVAGDLDMDGLKNLVTEAVEKTSMGDASIVVLGWYYYYEKGFHVEFLTADSGLKSQESPQPQPPTRRSTRGK